MREEYRAALSAATASQPPSEPQTPYLSPETPGLPVPATHYLANELHFSSPPHARETRPLPTHQATSYMSYPASGPSFDRQTSLSNFIAMRHSQRSASVLGEGLTSAFGAGFGMSALASSTFATPPRASSFDELAARGQLSRADSEEFMKQSAKLKPVLLQAIEEVMGELESTHEDVAKGAKEHVHSSYVLSYATNNPGALLTRGSEIILTLGHSRTVVAFLKQAHRDRSFTVIVAESAPSFSGHQTATSLSAIGIPTILVPDATIFALMPRITKVIIGCHSVLANGGLFALSGTLGTVLAAKAHAKPVMVVTGQFKFAPTWNLYHDHGAVDFQGPGAVVGFDGSGGGGGVEGAEASNPFYDYIRPELINLFVTNEYVSSSLPAWPLAEH